MKVLNKNTIYGLSVMVPLSLSPLGVAAMTLPVVLNVSEDLVFGTIFETGAGTVEILSDGTRNVSGGVQTISGAGIASQGILTLAGSTGLSIEISVTATSFTMTNGTDTMTVSDFHLVTNSGGPSATITIPGATNPRNFNVGATLSVSAGQAEGAYSGDFVIVANYQ